MALPEPIPPLTRKESQQFFQRVKKFKLSDEQKAFWAKDESGQND